MRSSVDSIDRGTRQYVKATHFYYLGAAFAITTLAAMLALPAPYHLLPFVLVFGTLLVIATLKYPFAGLMVYLTIFFLQANILFPALGRLPIPYERMIAILVACSFLINIAFVRKRFDFFRADYAYFAFMVACFLSILGASDLQTAWDTFIDFSKIFLVYLLIIRIVDSPGKMKALIILYVLCVGFLAISSSVEYYSGNFEVRQGIERAHSLGDVPIDPNTLATTIILAIPFIFFLIKTYRNKLIKISLLMLLLSCIWTVILTGSRGGMVGIIILVLLLAWQSRYRTAAIAIGLSAIIILAAVMPDQYRERFMTIGSVSAESTSGASTSALGRIKGLFFGLELMMQRPLTGVGIGNFSWYFGKSGHGFFKAHNMMGTLAGELGLLGIGTFFFLIITFLRNVKYVRMRYSQSGWKPDFNFNIASAIKLGIIMLFVLGLFGHNLFRMNWYIFGAFSVVLANLTAVRLQADSESSDIDLSPADASAIEQKGL